MEQQKRISKYLQIIAIALAIGVLAVVLLIGCGALSTRQSGGALWLAGVWTCFYGGCSLVMLFHFYRVCIRIGDGESFSKENADSFTCIERVSYIGGALAATRSIWCIVAYSSINTVSEAGLIPMTYAGKILLLSIVEIFAFVIFGFVCRALSHLIVNAAKIKEENDLTI